MKRICFVGASTVEGYGDATGRGWPGRLALANPDTVIPYNLGVRGQTLAEISKRAAGECAARIPDASVAGIVLCSGVNDLARLDDGTVRTPSTKINRLMEALIISLREIAPVIVIGPFPVLEAKMPFYAAASGLNFHFSNENIAVADAGYQQIAESAPVPYLSMCQRLLDNADYMAGLDVNDGIHTDGDGYQTVADIVSAWDGWKGLIR